MTVKTKEARLTTKEARLTTKEARPYVVNSAATELMLLKRLAKRRPASEKASATLDFPDCIG